MTSQWARRKVFHDIPLRGAGPDPVILQNAGYGVAPDLVSNVQQRAPDPRIAPRRVLPRHPHDQGADFRPDSWTSDLPPAAVVLLGDQVPIPAQDRVRRDDARNLGQDSPAELLPSYGEPTPLRVGQAERTTAQLLSEDSILLTEIVDQIFLVSV